MQEGMKIVANSKLIAVKQRQTEMKKMGKDLGKSKQAKDLMKLIKNNWDESKQGEMNNSSVALVLSSMIMEMAEGMGLDSKAMVLK